MRFGKSTLLVLATCGFLFVASQPVTAGILPFKRSVEFEHKDFEGDNAMPAGYRGTMTGMADTPVPGILTLPVGNFYILQDIWGDADDRGGWTGEFRFKLDANAIEDDTHTFQMQWRIGDVEGTAPNTHQIYRISRYWIRAVGGGIDLVGDSTDPGPHSGPDLADGFHTLRVAQEPRENVFHTWLDGVKLGTTGGPFGPADNTPWFGCGGTGCNLPGSGDVQIDYFRWTGEGGFSIPEPSTLILVVVASLGLAGFRRRR